MSEFSDKLSRAFTELDPFLNELDVKVPEFKEQLDNARISLERLHALSNLNEEIQSLISLGKHLKGEQTELDSLRKLLETNKKETKEIVKALKGLDPKALQGLNAGQLLLTVTTSKILKNIKETNRDFKNLRDRSAGIHTAALVVEKLGQGLKTVFNSILGVFGVTGGISGAIEKLRGAYSEAKKIGASTYQIGLDLGQTGLGSGKSDITGLFDNTWQNIDEYRQKWGMTYQESVELMETVGRVGLGSPIDTKTFNTLSDLIVTINKTTGLQPELAAKIIRQEVHGLGTELKNIPAIIGTLQSRAQSMGMDFTSYAFMIDKNTQQFADSGQTLLDVSETFDRIYHSDILGSLGIKSTLSQTEKFLKTLTQIKTGDFSDNLLAAVISNRKIMENKPFLVAMQDVKRLLISSSPNSKGMSGEVEKGITDIVRQVPVKNFMTIQMILRQIGLDVDKTTAFAIAEGFNTGKIKEQLFSDLLDKGTAPKTPGTDSRGRKLLVNNDEVTKSWDQLMKLYQHYGIDNITQFEQSFMVASMKQSLQLEKKIEGLLSKFTGVADFLKGLGNMGAMSPGILAAIAIGLGLTLKFVSGALRGIIGKLKSIRLDKVDFSKVNTKGVTNQLDKVGISKFKIPGGKAGKLGLLLAGAGLATQLFSSGSAEASEEIPELPEPEYMPETPRKYFGQRNLQQEKSKQNLTHKFDQEDIAKRLKSMGIEKDPTEITSAFHQKSGMIKNYQESTGVQGVFGKLNNLTINEKKEIDQIMKTGGSMNDLFKWLDKRAETTTTDWNRKSKAFSTSLDSTKSNVEKLQAASETFYKSVNNELYRFKQLKLEDILMHGGDLQGKEAIGTSGVASTDLISIIRRNNPQDADAIIQALQQASAQYHIPISVLASQLFIESGFRTDLTSPVGASGIAQFMPGTWAQYGKGKNVRDATAAIDAQARYMQYIHNYLGQYAQKLGLSVDSMSLWKFSLAGYNAGEGTASSYLRKLKALGKQSITYADTSEIWMSRENRDYVPKAISFLEQVNMRFNDNQQLRVYNVNSTQEVKNVLDKEGVTQQ